MNSTCCGQNQCLKQILHPFQIKRKIQCTTELNYLYMLKECVQSMKAFISLKNV